MSTVATRDKWAEALAAYNTGTVKALPGDNPYRYLITVHDDSFQHQGMQPNCPACAQENAVVVGHDEMNGLHVAPIRGDGACSEDSCCISAHWSAS